MENKEEKRALNPQSLLITVLFGGMLALGGCCLLLLLLSVLILMGIIPEHNIPHLCIALCAVCALIGGRYAVKRGEAPPILTGVLTGALVCVLILLIGYGGFSQPSMEGYSRWVLLAALAGGGLSGLAKPVKRGKGRKRKKK